MVTGRQFTAETLRRRLQNAYLQALQSLKKYSFKDQIFWSLSPLKNRHPLKNPNLLVFRSYKKSTLLFGPFKNPHQSFKNAKKNPILADLWYFKNPLLANKKNLQKSILWIADHVYDTFGSCNESSFKKSTFIDILVHKKSPRLFAYWSLKKVFF